MQYILYVELDPLISCQWLGKSRIFLTSDTIRAHGYALQLQYATTQLQGLTNNFKSALAQS
jgi:hypothetical protein